MVTPPTDNLYKFMAVFGLALIITAFVLISQLRRDFNEAHVARMVEDARVGAAMIEQSQAVLELAKRLGSTDEQTEAGARETTEILKQMQQYRRSWEDEERSPSYVRAEAMYKYAKESFESGIRSSTFLLGAGIIISAVGFFLWYVRVQRLLDDVLVREATKADAAGNEGAT